MGGTGIQTRISGNMVIPLSRWAIPSNTCNESKKYIKGSSFPDTRTFKYETEMPSCSPEQKHLSTYNTNQPET